MQKQRQRIKITPLSNNNNNGNSNSNSNRELQQQPLQADTYRYLPTTTPVTPTHISPPRTPPSPRALPFPPDSETHLLVQVRDDFSSNSFRMMAMAVGTIHNAHQLDLLHMTQQQIEAHVIHLDLLCLMVLTNSIRPDSEDTIHQLQHECAHWRRPAVLCCAELELACCAALCCTVMRCAGIVLCCAYPWHAVLCPLECCARLCCA